MALRMMHVAVKMITSRYTQREKKHLPLGS